ncbi:MFS transporter [Virgisporangium aliadipatigenens]|uniref:MFS transporter n=1 Tax=Virgisporangium aliadipatigenens TaxID=741659 RepID=A0A8J4DS26_9ACTN|nr:MFS transporter [Virgisporangium aliadipatigenens]GIJ48760.1 MFS transporter [Virgisporangium aliadipatigenens]
MSRRAGAFAVLCVVQFMVILDSTITVVALDAIRTDLHVGERSLQYVLTLYAVPFGGLLLLAGRLSDLVGRRPVFLAGTALFTAASLLCASAGAPAVLLTGRAVQGAGAALVSSAAFAAVLDLYPQGERRHRALGVWSALGASGAAAGLILGGVLTDLVGWRFVFAVNVPPGIGCLAVAALVLPRTPGRPVRLDLPAAVLTTLGVGTLVFALSLRHALLLLLAALLLAVAALLHTPRPVPRRAPRPVGTRPARAAGMRAVRPVGLAVPVGARVSRLVRVVGGRVARRVRRGGSLAVAALAVGALMAVVGSQDFFLTLYLQRVRGFGATAAGLVIAPAAGSAFVGSAVASRAVTRMPPRVVVVGGLACVAVAQWLLARLRVDGLSTVDLLPGLLLFGFGLGVTFVGATVLGTAGRPAGLASGVLGTAQQVGLAVGVAALVGAVASDGPPADLVAGYNAGLRAGAALTAVTALLVAATHRWRNATRAT